MAFHVSHGRRCFRYRCCFDVDKDARNLFTPFTHLGPFPQESAFGPSKVNPAKLSMLGWVKLDGLARIVIYTYLRLRYEYGRVDDR